MLTQEMMESVERIAMEELSLSLQDVKQLISQQMATMRGIRVTPVSLEKMEEGYQSFLYSCLMSRIMKMKNHSTYKSRTIIDFKDIKPDLTFHPKTWKKRFFWYLRKILRPLLP